MPQFETREQALTTINAQTKQRIQQGFKEFTSQVSQVRDPYTGMAEKAAPARRSRPGRSRPRAAVASSQVRFRVVAAAFLVVAVFRVAVFLAVAGARAADAQRHAAARAYDQPDGSSRRHHNDSAGRADRPDPADGHGWGARRGTRPARRRFRAFRARPPCRPD